MDNYDLWEANEREKEKWLKKRPVCRLCKNHIQDEDAYLIGNDWYCEDCMQENKVYIEDYIANREE